MALSFISCWSSCVPSVFLEREVVLHFYMPRVQAGISSLPVLLINDGQEMGAIQLAAMLDGLYAAGAIQPFVAVAVEAGSRRLQEYGVPGHADYKGRGALAAAYARFITEELLPYAITQTRLQSFSCAGFAGFSLGGLSALATTWQYPQIFNMAAVFSGSLWWRSMDCKDAAYEDERHRIMQQCIRQGQYNGGQRYFFQCGLQDEANDRNGNGIIDAVDDTRDTVTALINSGCSPQHIYYLELPEGRHDMATWARSMPVFLQWAFGTQMHNL